jgi:hypothetical protein
MSISIIHAILAIKSDAKVAVRGDDVDRIEWQDGETPIPKSDIQAKQAELKIEYDAQEYARKRSAEYPTIGDQLDMLWHAVDTGDWTPTKVKTTEFYIALKAVKDAHPKP